MVGECNPKKKDEIFWREEVKSKVNRIDKNYNKSKYEIKKK